MSTLPSSVLEKTCKTFAVSVFGVGNGPKCSLIFWMKVYLPRTEKGITVINEN
jgi:hypothetical protein